MPIRPGAADLHLRLSRFRRSPIPLLTEPGAARLFSSIVSSSGDHPSMCRYGLVLLDFIFGCPVSGGHPSHCLPSPVLLDLFLRLSPLQVVTHLSANLSWCWTSFSAIPFSAGHPSHCWPSPLLLDLFLRLAPLQIVTHLIAYLSWCCWTLCSAVPFSGGHPSYCRQSPVLLDLFLPNADRVRRCLTFFFDCLLFRWSPIQVLTQNGAAGLHLQLVSPLVFRRSPIPLSTVPDAA